MSLPVYMSYNAVYDSKIFLIFSNWLDLSEIVYTNKTANTQIRYNLH